MYYILFYFKVLPISFHTSFHDGAWNFQWIRINILTPVKITWLKNAWTWLKTLLPLCWLRCFTAYSCVHSSPFSSSWDVKHQQSACQLYSLCPFSPGMEQQLDHYSLLSSGTNSTLLPGSSTAWRSMVCNALQLLNPQVKITPVFLLQTSKSVTLTRTDTWSSLVV